MYSYCYVCSVLDNLFHFVVKCIVCVWMCTVLLPPDVNPIAVNKYIKSFNEYIIILQGTVHVTLKKSIAYAFPPRFGRRNVCRWYGGSYHSIGTKPLFRMQVFSNGVLCFRMSGSRCSEGTYCLHIPGILRLFDPWGPSLCDFFSNLVKHSLSNTLSLPRRLELSPTQLRELRQNH